jgi:hypothetical protein
MTTFAPADMYRRFVGISLLEVEASKELAAFISKVESHSPTKNMETVGSSETSAHYLSDRDIFTVTAVRNSNHTTISNS